MVLSVGRAGEAVVVLMFLTLLSPRQWLSPAAGQGVAATQNAKKDVDEKTIRGLIAALGDDSSAKRDAADKALVAIGRPALTLLRKAANEADDLEVRDRAANLVRTITAGPGPGVLIPGSSTRDIAISKDNQTMAIAFENKTVGVYDFKTMALRHTLRGHTNVVWAVAISPDGRTLVSSAGDFGNGKPHEIIVWDLAKGTAMRTLKGHDGGAFGLAFSPDGANLYSGGLDGTVRIWEVASSKEIGVLRGHEGWVRRVHATSDGKLIISCGIDSTVRIWNRETGQEVRRMKTSHDGIGSAAITPDGKWYITGSRRFDVPDPGVITVWDVATGNEKTTVKGPTRYVAGLAVSPDSKLLAMSGRLGEQMSEVKIFELATGKEIAAFHDHRELVEAVAFSPDGNWLVTGSFGGVKSAEVRVWDVKKLRGKGE